ncbi:hypothetical protein GCM10022243_65400 [Saccharothrix violaceirubra]|uniref:4Fe-4S Wbl-type domain-containing protein n=1 Tax=Saccharothrix violaceirubra TaxID=413306 RepID=A0A7W7WZL0_9PSEU|nr:WhiB family transcriptional regulator [Saccharothrix violaceirubra]MBB4968973.1 hypothetical protein [Saccharothrix violaceirubra]
MIERHRPPSVGRHNLHPHSLGFNNANPLEPAYAALLLALFGGNGRAPDWHAQAACRDTDPEAFFTPNTTAATSVCAGCPVADLCLKDQLRWESADRAVNRYTVVGVFGGVDGPGRRALHKPKRRHRAA